MLYHLKIGCVIALWGCAMQAGANNVATLLVGRIIGGLAIGYTGNSFHVNIQ